MDRATARQRNARRGIVRSRRNRRTAQTIRKKRGEARMVLGLNPSTFGFPNTIVTKLRYCTFLDLTAAAGVVAQNIFNANSIFDPDNTGVGHQPLYRDNFANIYDQYVVLGSRIKVTFVSSSTTLGHYIGITGDDDNTTSSNLETLMEQNNSVHSMIGASSAPPGYLTATFSPLSKFGVAAKDDGSSATAMGANPTELWCWKVWALPSDAATTSHCYCKVEIDYTVKFTELSTQTQN